MIKKFIPYLHQYKKPLIYASILVIIEGLFELAIPMLMSDIIDIGVANHDIHFIYRRGFLMIGMTVFAMILGFFYAKLAGIAGQGFGAELRKAEYKKIQSFSFSNMDHFSTSSLITRLTSDVLIVQNALANGLRPLVRAPVMLISGLVFSFVINPHLAIIFFFTLPILATGLILIIKHVQPFYFLMQKTLDHLNLVIEENLTAIRVVKSFVREDYEDQKFENVNQELASVANKSYGTAILNSPLMMFCMYATIIAILWFGGNLSFKGIVQIGDLTGVLTYVLQILNSLMMLSNVFMLLARSTSSARRIAEVLDEKIALNEDKKQDIQVENGDIQFNHVFFKYQLTAEEYVLSDISLHIQSGETFGILGGTGAAKTSLVQLIPRLYDITSGELKVSGHPVQEFPLADLRNSVAVVLQKNTLFSGSILDNLRWGNPNATMEEAQTACRAAAIDDFIQTLPEKYNTQLGQGGTGVSGGQRQRLCIARALLKHPKILILDDSTSAVDTATESHIRNNLAEIYPGMTKIIIAQRISSVSHADHVLILDDGKANAIGTPEKLLAENSIYQEIYHTQQTGAQI